MSYGEDFASWMSWSHHGPMVCFLDFSEWGGGWGDTIYIVDYGYVVLPR
jgi:hypothetical protein